MAHEIYIHGTSEAEQDRLGLMNRLLNRRAIAQLGLAGGERCLEMGAGTGWFAAALAGAVGPGGSVLAIERDAQQLAAARRNTLGAANLELRAGDALAPPLRGEEWGSFDLVHARFLLEHLADPLSAVHAMARALRPGGRLVLVDDDHRLLRLWPEAPRFARLWEEYWRYFARLGTDPNVGARLVELVVSAGLRPSRVDALFYGGCQGVEGFAGVIENLERVVGTALSGMLAEGVMGREEIDAAHAELARWRERPEATLWYALPWVEATRDAAG